MMQQFLPVDYEQLLYQKYHQCQQGQESVNEYTEEFIKLDLRANMRECEPQKVSRYVQSLNSPIRERLELSQTL